MNADALRAHVGVETGEPFPAYAWPAGYAIAYVMDDGETLCADCMNRETECVHFGGDADGWRVEGAFAYGADADYPETDEHCAHCNALICEAID